MDTLPQLVSALEKRLALGRRQTQSRLPTERKLASQLGITRSALRRALSVLEADGKIWRHVGRGTFTGPRPAAERSTLTLVARQTSPAEVMQVRLIIEPETAALAARHATAAQIERMATCVRKSRATSDVATYELWDSNLHRTIAEAAGNLLLLALLDAVNAIREENIWGNLKKKTLTRQRQNLYSRQHESIVKAISTRDSQGAQRCMRAHLETVSRDLAG
ncbi:MAG: FCD domain-containing protein [Burkholderiales bacterium]|nr:FCD domain-containing protein [Burkholderiales bacterium]